ncbi:acyl-CoA dehydrogenase family protein [Actinomadura sp. J1-007]|nr:acyl-CoA dehydrogenase family protein [Actinomadura sp. J1-007]
METPEGYDPAVWARMAGELGLQGLAVPEEHGGAGFGVRELAVVFEEMGRALVCSPYLATVALAATALSACGDGGARRDLLPGIASGETIATLVDGASLTAREEGGAWTLSGAETYVLDGHVAGLVLAAVPYGGETALFAVDADAAAESGALARTVLPTVDQTRRLARLVLTDVPARRIAGDAADAVQRAYDVAAVALAAEQLGGAQRTLDMTVEYAKVRRQFGRPIGSFQAVKHRCADMFVQVESARSAVLNAAAVADEAPGELPAAAALAKAYCSDAYAGVAGEGIQIHGGIGFTWEHDAHLYFKRAHGSRQLFGAPDVHRERLAALAGIVPA